jgi:ribosomal protein L25 (general stress protein Ctc)
LFSTLTTEVTETLRRAGDFAAVVATEASEPMVRRLRQKKFDLVVESTTIDDIAKMASDAASLFLLSYGQLV